MLLEGKVIFLTGGASGIGRECAIAYAAEGAKVTIADIDENAAEESAQTVGAECIGLACDVSHGASVERAIHLANSHFGRLDAVHNNAGIANPAESLDETSEEERDRLMSTNSKSVIHGARLCAVWDCDVIADAAVFLLSEKARFMTGCILPVSGGAELGYRR
jgi:NAD(P)-dependent dehydrogenase (short-subunit alcohol dehydrogenase family)